MWLKLATSFSVCVAVYAHLRFVHPAHSLRCTAMVLLDGRRCGLCDRHASLYGLRNPHNGFIGWCTMCQHHYQQNEQDWILRCVCKPVMSPRAAYAPFSSPIFRNLVVVLLRGSLVSTETRAQMIICGAILYAGGPKYVHEDGEPREASDSEYDEYKPYVNPLWKLPGRLCELLFAFLGDYQKRHRRV